MIAGIAPLLQMRRRGMKPSGTVFLNAFDAEPRACRRWHLYPESIGNPELWIRPGTNPATVDLSALAGLHVALHADHWTAWLSGCWETLLEYVPASALLVITDFEDDVGFVWTPEHGQRCVGDAPPEDVFVLAADRVEAIAYARAKGVANDHLVHVEGEHDIRRLGHGKTLLVLPGAKRRADYAALIDRAAWKFCIRHEETA